MSDYESQLIKYSMMTAGGKRKAEGEEEDESNKKIKFPTNGRHWIDHRLVEIGKQKVELKVLPFKPVDTYPAVMCFYSGSKVDEIPGKGTGEDLSGGVLHSNTVSCYGMLNKLRFNMPIALMKCTE